jgi:hypothetical protein
MNGRAEVARQQQQLDASFKRAGKLKADSELQSDFARYLCILVSGFLEQAVVEILMEYARKHADERAQSYIEQRLRNLANVNATRLAETIGSFDSEWRKDLEKFLVDEYKDAVDGVVDLRNTIAHGRYAGVSMVRMAEYYKRIKMVVAEVSRLVQ